MSWIEEGKIYFKIGFPQNMFAHISYKNEYYPGFMNDVKMLD